MSAAPFDVGAIVTRLRSAVAALRTVGLAADYAAVTSLQDFPAPCAYVVLVAEQGLSQPAGHAPRGQQVRARQAVQAHFAVILAVRNYREAQGGQLAGELATLLAGIRAALMGYVPDLDGARPCEFVRGDLQDYSAGVALWADVYSTQHSIGN